MPKLITHRRTPTINSYGKEKVDGDMMTREFLGPIVEMIRGNSTTNFGYEVDTEFQESINSFTFSELLVETKCYILIE